MKFESLPGKLPQLEMKHFWNRNKIANYEIEKLSFKLYMRSSYTITVMAATTAIFNTEQKHNSINE
jgi:hypothetical protein